MSAVYYLAPVLPGGRTLGTDGLLDPIVRFDAPAIDSARTENELLDRADILSLAEKSAGIGIWDMDMAMRTVRATPQFFQIVGLEPTDQPVPIERLRALRHPDDRDQVVSNFTRVLERGEDSYDAEYRIIRPDGEIRWVYGRGRVVRDASGKPIRYSGVDIDVTGRKRTEEALRESEQRYRALVENAHDLIYTLDLDFHFTSVNPAVQQHLGYSPEDLIGTALTQYLAPDQVARKKAMLQRKLAGEVSETRYEMEVIDRTGQIRTLEANSWLSFDRNGRPQAIQAIARDITARKKYEEHLAFTTRELSHRTKNILAVVQAMVRQIGKQTTDFTQFQDRFGGCIEALAYCHDLLIDGDWQGADLQNLIALQVAPFGGLDGKKFVATGPELKLAPQAAQLIGLALHELATNAAKHGALTSPAGAVVIEWQPVDANGAMRLVWKEQNGPSVTPPKRRGFGHTVLERMAATLGGEVSLAFPPDGVRWAIAIDEAHIVR